MVLHNLVCEKLGISRAELGKKLGVSKSTIDAWSDASRISRTTQVALELMLENHNLKEIIRKYVEFQQALSIHNEEYSFNNPHVSAEHKKIIENIEKILKEYGFNAVMASRFLGLAFEELDQILSFKKYPTNKFLDDFCEHFGVNPQWLIQNKEYSKPFDVKLIKTGYPSSFLKDEAMNFSEIFIVHCENNEKYTRVIVKNDKNVYDILETLFCIGKYFIMEARESSDLYDLYKIYKQCGNVRLLTLDEDDYKAGIEKKDKYLKNILARAKSSDLLYYLFRLDEDEYKDNKEEFGFYYECLNILKYSIKRDEEKNS